MSEDNKGFILLECLLSLAAVAVMTGIIANVVSLKRNAEMLIERNDYYDMQQTWEDHKRCKIYCPGEEPIVDITF